MKKYNLKRKFRYEKEGNHYNVSVWLPFLQGWYEFVKIRKLSPGHWHIIGPRELSARSYSSRKVATQSAFDYMDERGMITSWTD